MFVILFKENDYLLSFIPRILLTNSGHLLQFCEISKMFFPPFEVDYLIDEIAVMGENSNGFFELLLLTKPQNKKQIIKIVEFPSESFS